jgi:hypothetical protein
LGDGTSKRLKEARGRPCEEATRRGSNVEATPVYEARRGGTGNARRKPKLGGMVKWVRTREADEEEWTIYGVERMVLEDGHGSPDYRE